MMKIFVYLLLALAATSCASAPSACTSGLYCDPNGWFSYTVPTSLRKDREVTVGEQATMVCFYGDFGELVRFEVTKIPTSNIPKTRELFSNCQALEELAACYTAEIQTDFPGTKMLHREIVRDADECMLYFLLKIPQGGTLADSCSGMRADSFRGFLLFLSDDMIVLEGYQNSVICANMYKEGDPWMASNTLRLLKQLKDGFRGCSPCSRGQ